MWCTVAGCFGMGNDLLINGFAYLWWKIIIIFGMSMGSTWGWFNFCKGYAATWTNEFKKCFFGSLARGKSRKVFVLEAESFHRLWPDRRRCFRIPRPVQALEGAI